MSPCVRRPSLLAARRLALACAPASRPRSTAHGAAEGAALCVPGGRDRLRSGAGHRPVLAHRHRATSSRRRCSYDYLARPGQAASRRPPAAMPEMSADFRDASRSSIRPGIYFADDPAFKGKPRELVGAGLRLHAQAPLRPALQERRRCTCSRTTTSSACSELRADALEAQDSRSTTTARSKACARSTATRFAVRARRSRARASCYKLADARSRGAVAREVVETYGDAIMEHPVGTGPYRLAQWRRSLAHRAGAQPALTATSSTTSSPPPTTPTARRSPRALQGPARCR